ncbi:MAG TPA: DJ-1/PfpI family protein [Chloroflexota bacterium]|nr:DJ-1/PfpI family protein [Chloroflexota bacterium]
MKIAFVIYDGMTTLDFLGAYDALTRLKTMGFWPDLEWEICARSAVVTDGSGLRLLATKVDEPLVGYDLLVVPGGGAARTLQDDAAFIAWLRTAADTPRKTSVCSGSLLLGAAGFLVGKRATSHRSAQADLRPYCAEVLDARIVDEGAVVTARGVTSSIDLGLYLVEQLAGAAIKERIRAQMDYQGGQG